MAETVMRVINAFEAETTLNALLDDVERGEEITITRGGKAVARLVALAPALDREAAKAAADQIIADRTGKTLGGLNIKDLINEGRR